MNHPRQESRCKVPLVLALLATALVFSLVGCTQGRSLLDTSGKAEQKTSPYGLTGTVTMAEYMSERYGSFDEFAQAMEDGSGLVQSLRLYMEGTKDGYVHDEHVIRETWESLCAVRIDVDHPADASEDEEGTLIFFDFDSGREVIPFSFRTTAYAEFSQGDRFPVEDPDAVQAIVNDLAAHVEQEEAQLGDDVPFENGAYLWDADDDGIREHLWADYIDNGDEAPSVLSIRVFSDTMDVSGYIDRAYGIEGMTAGTDERGPYLTIRYTEGDYYAHDHEAACTLRVVDDELMIEYDN